ncbi:MAG: hypothetical protein J7K17_04185 [Candidatus Omnitrophica bacterium]|nr:hypothetical protein [Candidatus Omnitrophota bacterium]
MKILITGGASWVKIDEVRIITNVFTGKTALLLAQEAKKRGLHTTLIINPHCISKFPKGIRVIPFKYFQDLKDKVVSELKKNTYQLIIHACAVSDYVLKKPFKGKIPSKRKELVLKLFPAPKIVKIIRRLAKNSFVVQFKLEIEDEGIVDKAFRSLKENGTDLVVANSLESIKLGYKAFIIDKRKNIKKITSKKEILPAILNFLPK